MKLTAQLCKLDRNRSDCSLSMSLRHVCAGIGLMALFALAAALPASAEDVAPSSNPSPTPTILTRPGSLNPSPMGAMTGVETTETVLPSGAIRRTVRRVQTVQTNQTSTTDSLAANSDPLAAERALVDNMLKPSAQSPLLAMRRQANVGGHPLSVDLRLGASVSPRIKFVAGIDARIPGLSLGPGFTTRADLDAIFSANFGGVSTLVPLTIDELYHADLPGGHSFYGGIGIGPMFGEVTRFGGKIIVGANITPRLRLEGDVLFAGYGDALFNIMLRIPVL
jgi:hypothetical protein